MNNEIFIKENFKVDDTHSKVRGFVFAYDDNDNLVFARENMIVETGRRYIMKNGIKNGSFKLAFLSDDSNMVTADDKIEDFIKSSQINNETNGTVFLLNDQKFYYCKNELGATVFIKEDGTELTDDDIDIINENGLKNAPGSKIKIGSIIYTIGDDGLSENATDSNGNKITEELIDNFYNENGINKEDINSFEDFIPAVELIGIINKREIIIEPIDGKTLVSVSEFGCDINYQALNIEFTIVFDGNDIISANSLGLVVEDSEKELILFSRVTFPTYHKSATQKLTFKYYIYF